MCSIGLRARAFRWSFPSSWALPVAPLVTRQSGSPGATARPPRPAWSIAEPGSSPAGLVGMTLPRGGWFISEAPTPNWDLVVACDFVGKPGLALIEAKAHEGGLGWETSPRKIGQLRRKPRPYRTGDRRGVLRPRSHRPRGTNFTRHALPARKSGGLQLEARLDGGARAPDVRW